MLSCKKVKCGVAPVSACAVVNTGAGQVLSFGQEVTYDCQLGCHVGSSGAGRTSVENATKVGSLIVILNKTEVVLTNPVFRALWTSGDETTQRYGPTIVRHSEPLEFHCFDGFSSNETTLCC